MVETSEKIKNTPKRLITKVVRNTVLAVDFPKYEIIQKHGIKLQYTTRKKERRQSQITELPQDQH